MTDDLISRADAIDILRDYQSRQDVHIGMPSDSDVYAYARGMLIGICNNIEAIPSAQPKLDEWCTDCKEYDQDTHCCPRWNRVIRSTLKDAQPKRGGVEDRRNRKRMG